MAEKDTSSLLILYSVGAVARGRVISCRIPYARGSLGAGSIPSVATSIFFLSSSFYPLAFYGLF